MQVHICIQALHPEQRLCSQEGCLPLFVIPPIKYCPLVSKHIITSAVSALYEAKDHLYYICVSVKFKICRNRQSLTFVIAPERPSLLG